MLTDLNLFLARKSIISRTLKDKITHAMLQRKMSIEEAFIVCDREYKGETTLDLLIQDLDSIIKLELFFSIKLI